MVIIRLINDTTLIMTSNHCNGCKSKFKIKGKRLLLPKVIDEWCRIIHLWLRSLIHRGLLDLADRIAQVLDEVVHIFHTDTQPDQ